jgi:hypothetical protein
MPADTNSLPPPVNHVFVDFENVHEINLAVIGSKAVNFTLLLGPRQTKLDVALVEKLIEHSASVQLVRLTSSGNNALDFALAYYVGRAVAADPTGFFHIVSKDTGYDPLVEHLRAKHIHVRRHDDFANLTFARPAKLAPPPSDDLPGRILEHLRKNATSRPKRKKTLVSHLLAFSGNKATEAEVLGVIDHFRKAGHLDIDTKDAVTYHLEQSLFN